MARTRTCTQTHESSSIIIQRVCNKHSPTINHHTYNAGVCVRAGVLQAAYEILEHRRTARMAAAVVRLQAFLRGARSVSQSLVSLSLCSVQGGDGTNQATEDCRTNPTTPFIHPSTNPPPPQPPPGVRRPQGREPPAAARRPGDAGPPARGADSGGARGGARADGVAVRACAELDICILCVYVYVYV